MADWGLHSGTFLHILVSFEKENNIPALQRNFLPPKKRLKRDCLLQLLKWIICWFVFYKSIIKLINWCNNLM